VPLPALLRAARARPTKENEDESLPSTHLSAMAGRQTGSEA
jgi:hypothetical protein